jgi:CDP-paratose 2-epimerase
MVALITGCGGLIGSEAAKFFSEKGFDVVGIENDMRRAFFGDNASTKWNVDSLSNELRMFRNYEADIREYEALKEIYATYGDSIKVIIHAAAQPSHDWAASAPMVDFGVNATGTLNLLELTRQYCPQAVFIYLSTNKVYGDRPNYLPLVEQEKRWELEANHRFAARGIDESMSIDSSTHSLFGVSKASADLMVQEYGRYFGIRTACFRGGCLTGPAHSGAKLHGFLSYLMQCMVTGEPYTVMGYKGKQVRDNIHAYDLVNALWHFYQNPRSGEIYNIGGARQSNCSMLEAIELGEQISGRALAWSYSDENRVGDHMWWISDVSRFQSHYPDWNFQYGIEEILREIHDALVDRVGAGRQTSN